jgi:SAM-dependent methyltransferase
MKADAEVTLREQVRRVYSKAAEDPISRHPFPVGRTFAESLGYPSELLDRVPAPSVEAFTGVSDVSVRAPIETGMYVLDLGCGAGLDTVIAAQRLGPTGWVIGVDFSGPMLDRARRAVREAGCEQVVLCRADAERLPLPDACVDLALVNGLFNLNPARSEVLEELARVIRPGGAVYAAELILTGPLPPERQGASDWFA